MRVKLPILIAFSLVVGLSKPVSADPVLCIRNQMPVIQNGTIRLGRGIHLRQGGCARREKAVEIINSSALLKLIKQVDGSGSGLDADLLDGKDSSFFAKASDLSNLSGATSDLSAELSNMGLGENILRVGPGTQFATIAEAIAYATSQTPSDTKPFTVLLSPGVHIVSDTVILPAYVTLKGFGPRSSIVRGDESLATVIQSQPGTVISDLGVTSSQLDGFVTTLINLVGGTSYTPGDPTSIFHVVKNVRVEATGERNSDTHGITANASSKIENTEVLLRTTGAAHLFGISHFGGELFVHDTQVSALRFGAGMAIGIASTSSDLLSVKGSIAKASTFGVYKMHAKATVQNSRIISDFIGVLADFEATINILSSLINSPDKYLEGNGGVVNCMYVTDDNATEVDCTL